MIRSRFRLRWLALLGLAACATAQEDGVPNANDEASGGATVAMAGSSGAHSSVGTAGAFAGGGAAHGGASGLGGSPGAAGLGASAGFSGRAGSLGNAGTAGAAGTTGGSGGSSGTSPVFVAGACAASPTMSLSYKQGSSSPKQITAQYQFSNTSGVPIPLTQLKIRYFFSNEETSGWNTAIYDAKLEGGTGGYRPISGTTLTVVPLGVKLPGADSYAELAFASTLTIEKGATATINWDMQPLNYNAPDQVQTDDYSYDADATGFTVWDHVVIYQGSAAVWGCAPDGTGSGGAGGNAGSAGAGGASAGAGGASAGAGGASAGAGGASAGAGGASAGAGGASAGAGGASAGAGGASAGAGGASAEAGGASAGAAGLSAGGGGAGVSGNGGASSGGASAGGGGAQAGTSGSVAGSTQ